MSPGQSGGPGIEDVLAQVRAAWTGLGLAKPRGARPEEIAAFERRHRLALPSEVRRYFQALDGMGTAPRPSLDQDENGFCFWSLGRVVSVQELCGRSRPPRTPRPRDEHRLVIADYLVECWWYALDLDPAAAPIGRVLVEGGDKPARQVASSLTEFLELYLIDSQRLYGP